MKKIGSKPIGQVVISCYFFPLIIGLFFLEKGKTGFGVAVSCVSFAALVLFLVVKDWELQWKRFALQKMQDVPQKAAPVPTVPSIAPQEMEKKNQEIITLKESLLKVESEKKELYNEIARFKKETDILAKSQEEKLGVAQAALVEKTLTIQMREQEMIKLQEEINNLQFEIKTLLKIS